MAESRQAVQYFTQEGLLQSDKIFRYCKRLANAFVIITDDNVAPLYAESLLGLFKQADQRVDLLVIPHGEQSKARETKQDLEDKMQRLGYGRDTCVIAVGGGVVTDLAGFLAATYCRGVPCVYVPTSLLAMVDASIGGKTGVNTAQGKNLIGTFTQPKAIFVDINTLSTLPVEEIRNGFVEMIKHALIVSAEHFAMLSENVQDLLDLSSPLLQDVIMQSGNIKKDITACDETEQGMRQLLNCGHTIGHAIESASHFQLSHGEAVAIGLLSEAYLAMRLGLLKQKALIKIQEMLEALRLPLRLPDSCRDKAVLKQYMQLDKKTQRQTIRCVLLEDIGKPHIDGEQYSFPVDNNLLDDMLDWMLENF